MNRASDGRILDYAIIDHRSAAKGRVGQVFCCSDGGLY